MQNTDIAIDGHTTIPQLFRHRAKQLGDKVAMREKHLGIWHSYTWHDYYQYSQIIGSAMMALGLEPGKTVSIVADPCKEWLFFDMANQCAGMVSSGIYTTDAAEQLQYLCADSHTCLLVLENEEQLDKYLRVEDQLPDVSWVVVLDPKGLADLEHSKVMMLDDFLALGKSSLEEKEGQWHKSIEAIQANDTAMLVYTSGTTGRPKGAMISHRNILANQLAFSDMYTISSGDESVVYLPLCHVAEKSLSVYTPLVNCSVVNFIEASDTAFENIAEVSPTYFFGVPRIWEKMYSAVSLQMQDATWFGRTAFDLAMKVAGKAVALEDQGQPVPKTLDLARRFASAMVFSNIKVLLGLDKVRLALSGAAPISPQLISWFRTIGVPLYEGYGQTENAGIATANCEKSWRIGTIGRAPRGVELKLAEDGELLIKGALVFKGYFNLPEKTAETIQDGWLYTGDIAHIDDDGFVRIVDRKKDIIITAGGKNITPSEIENQLKFSPYIADAVVIGDQRKYLTCLVMIDNDNVSQYAQQHNIPFSDYKSLCDCEDIQKLIEHCITEVNKGLAQAETLKNFRLINKQLTAEDEELTATMKLKRNLVNANYADLINTMY